MFTAAFFKIAKKRKQFICPSTDEYINKYSYKRILFSHKKEWNIETCDNMDEPWKYYPTWKKPHTQKGHILYDSNYMKYSEYANPQREKLENGCQGLAEEGTGVWLLIGIGW